MILWLCSSVEPLLCEQFGTACTYNFHRSCTVHWREVGNLGSGLWHRAIHFLSNVLIEEATENLITKWLIN